MGNQKSHQKKGLKGVPKRAAEIIDSEGEHQTIRLCESKVAWVKSHIVKGWTRKIVGKGE